MWLVNEYHKLWMIVCVCWYTRTWNVSLKFNVQHKQFKQLKLQSLIKNVKWHCSFIVDVLLCKCLLFCFKKFLNDAYEIVAKYAFVNQFIINEIMENNRLWMILLYVRSLKCVNVWNISALCFIKSLLKTTDIKFPFSFYW